MGVPALIVGYARVSTDEQKMDLQIRALEAAGCVQIFTDHGQSGSVFNREGLDSAIGSLEPGGTLVVWRLDRLGRSLIGLIQLMDQLGKREVHFQSLTEHINTASSGGRLMFHMMAALAEFERSLISERTRAGLSAAKAKGTRLGRPKALSEAQITYAIEMLFTQKMTLEALAREFNVSERTVRRHVMANWD